MCDIWPIETKNDTKRHSMCEIQRAKNFTRAYNFNTDELCNKCILHKTLGDIFAVDVYAYKN